MRKQAQYKIQGMQRDLSESAFSSRFAYENMNMRLMPNDGNTMFSLTNERGNSIIPIDWGESEGSGNDFEAGNFIIGTPIGRAVIDHNLVIFSTIPAEERDRFTMYDRIYRFWYEGDKLNGRVLFRGNIGFDVYHPLETLVSFESENIKKVYWVDGINQPRMINIVSPNTQTSKFDFVTNFTGNMTMTIERLNDGSGVFPACAVRYFVTYYKKYGQETNVVATSPMYYASKPERGGSPDETMTCSFRIKLDLVDITFDYARIYSVHRTSENAAPSAYIVADVPISNGTYVEYVDNGTHQQTIDPTILMYIGGMEITATTIEQKDNTLFLGNIDMQGSLFSQEETTQIKKFFEGSRSNNGDGNSTLISFDYHAFKVASGTESYVYENQLDPANSASIDIGYHGIRHFKKGERYRVGIQFCTDKGQWSQVFFVGDATCDKSITYGAGNNTVNKPYISVNIDSSPTASVLRDILKNHPDIKGARLMIAKKLPSDMLVLAQGVLCPTVFNLGQRMGKAPFAVSSWFMRPDNDHMFNNEHMQNVQGEYISTSSEIEGFSHVNDSAQGNDSNQHEYIPYAYSSINAGATSGYAVVSISITYSVKRHSILIGDKVTSVNIDRYTIFLRSGATQTVKYNVGDSGMKHRNAYDFLRRHIKEISYNNMSPVTDAQLDSVSNTDGTANHLSTYSAFCNNFSADQTYSWKQGTFVCVVSEDAVGESFVYPNFFVDRSIVTFHSPDIEVMRDRIHDNNVKVRVVGYAPITANTSRCSIDADNTTIIYAPGAGLQEYDFDTGNMTNESSGMKTFPMWADAMWKQVVGKGEGTDDQSTTGDSDQLSERSWDSYGSTLYPIYPWQASGSLNGHPKNTLDKYEKTSSVLVTKKLANMRFSMLTRYGSSYDYGSRIPKVCLSDNIEYANAEGVSYQGNYDYLVTHSEEYPKYNIGFRNASTNKNTAATGLGKVTLDSYDRYPMSSKPVRIKYKSTPHAVINLGNTTLPVPGGQDYGNKTMPWGSKISASAPDVYATSQYPYVWMAEIYVDYDKTSWMGGTGDNAIENATWLVGGETSAVYATGSIARLVATEGDTYFQRWDCLKTYPFTENDENSVIDITSFMVETRTNIDGRYDTNRGGANILYARPRNFGLVNRGYTQDNNVVTYRALDEKFDLNAYRNQITWSKTKENSADVDAWTNVTLASSLELDGDKGSVTELTRFGNALLCFQESGISEIQFNNMTAVQTTSGVPLEIANSGKVTGKNYLTSSIGCSNQFSICHGEKGLYFIDDIRRSMFSFNGQFRNLSESLGFSSWSLENISGNAYHWDPSRYRNFTVQYDWNTKDVMFISSDSCLCFSEPLDQFVSFYSYEAVPYICSFDDKTIAVSQRGDMDDEYYRMWEQRSGEYNMFFGEYREFYTEIVANPDMPVDKIFDNVEFRSDSWNEQNELLDSTFDNLEVWNEYQYGETPLLSSPGHPSSLKRKFRVWRANVPRDSRNNRDRIRNTWAHIKLSMKHPNINRTILHDIVIAYFAN